MTTASRTLKTRRLGPTEYDRTFSLNRLAAMADNDWRRGSAEFMEPKLSRNVALGNATRPVAFRNRTSVSSVAVARALAWPEAGMHP